MTQEVNASTQYEVASQALRGSWINAISRNVNVNLDSMKSESSIPASLAQRELSVGFLDDEESLRLVAAVISPEGKMNSEVIFAQKYEHQLELFGDLFVVYRDQEGFSLYHPTWTLGGSGATLQLAIDDLKETIRFLREDLDSTPTDKLDATAFAFREYLHESLNI